MSRLLIIDDNEDFRETISDLLREAGHEVHSVGSPDEGRAELVQGGFDLVLCDLVMPLNPASAENPDWEEGFFESESAMVGVHAIGQFVKEFPTVPVIAVSGKLVGEPLKILDQFGAFSTLSKPFSRQQLLDAVNAAVSREKPAAN